MEEEKKKRFRFKKLWIVLGFFVVAGGAGAWYVQQPDPPEYSSVLVEKTDLVQSVNETGSVVADLELRYGWEMAGRVISIEKEVGDEVTEGELIAALDVVKERARYTEALSALSAARATLNLELVGPSDEEKNQSVAAIDQAKAALDQAIADKEKTIVNGEKRITTAEKAVQTAQNNLQLAEGGEDSDIINDAYADLVNVIKSAFTTVSDSINEADNILGVDNDLANNDFDDYLSVGDVALISIAEQRYITAKKSRKAAEGPAIDLRFTDPHDEVDSAALVTEDALFDSQAVLFAVQNVLEATRPLGTLSQSELETLKANITTAQVAADSALEELTNSKQAITTARNSLSSYTIAYDKAVLDLENEKKQVEADIRIADAKVRSQEAAVKQAQASYDTLVAAPRSVDVAALRSDVARQQANVAAFKADVDKGSLVALADGVISALDVEIGENVSLNQEVVALISPELTVEVDISESDIAKVAIDDMVEITLDAFTEDDVFQGRVVSIEPAETEVSGVIYYKTKIILEDIGAYDIRPGMTANVTITTDGVSDALVIPQRAILQKNGQNIVRVITNKERVLFDEVPVTLGLRGDNGVVAVTSGLSEGQEIITFIKTE